jgi:hypothetical protein
VKWAWTPAENAACGSAGDHDFASSRRRRWFPADRVRRWRPARRKAPRRRRRNRSDGSPDATAPAMPVISRVPVAVASVFHRPIPGRVDATPPGFCARQAVAACRAQSRRDSAAGRSGCAFILAPGSAIRWWAHKGSNLGPAARGGRAKGRDREARGRVELREGIHGGRCPVARRVADARRAFERAARQSRNCSPSAGGPGAAT